MAYAVVNQSGSTGVVQVSVDSCNETAASGNYRTVYLAIVAYPQDYTGARDCTWSVSSSSLGISRSSSGTINGDGVWMYEGSVRVYVAPGTTYANTDISFSITVKSPSSGNKTTTGTISQIAELSILADAAITSAADIYFGNPVSVTWSPAASTFAYKLKFTLGNYSYETGVIAPGSTNAYTYTGLTVPLDVMNDVTNSTYGTMTVTMTQYKTSSGTETVGSASSRTFKVNVPANVRPTILSHSVGIDNSGNATVGSWGIGVVGFSRANVKAAAAGTYGSTIKSFKITGSATTTVTGSELDYKSDIFTSYGDKFYTITCTDSRGRVSEEVKTDLISVLSYTPPKLTNLVAEKKDYGTTDTTDDRMVLTATWEFDSLGGHNSATGVAYYKESGASDWTKHSGTVYMDTPFTVSELQLVDTKSYNFKVVVTDAVGNSSEKDSFASTTTVLLDFRAGGKGLGIGKICESDRMEVSMKASFYDEVTIRRGSDQLLIDDYIKAVVFEAIYPVGSIYMSLNATSPQVLFSGKWERLDDRFLIGAGTSYTVGTTGGEESHTLTVEEMPQHKHSVTSGSMNKAVQVNDNASSKIYPAYSEINTSNDAWVQYTGGSAAHNNMPPYLAVYMWKRVS